MAVAGPELSGSGTGVPVPSSTTFVRGAPAFDTWLASCCGAAAVATVTRAATKMTRVSFMATSDLFESLIASKRPCLAEELNEPLLGSAVLGQMEVMLCAYNLRHYCGLCPSD